MAATIEFLPEVNEYTGERFAHSLSDIRHIGHIARLGFDASNPEHAAAYEYSFDNLITALTENIATDSEFGEKLNLGTLKVRPYVDDHIRTQRGEPLVDVPIKGAEASKDMADKDPGYMWQYTRDSGDVAAARFFDRLHVGENGFALSYYPAEQMEANPGVCEKIGYLKGMSILHQVYKVDESTVYTWTYAIKESDKKAFSQIFLEDYGLYIPPDTHSDLWSRHFHKSNMTLEEAHEFGVNVARRHQGLTGTADREYHSATEFLELHRDTVQEYFERYVVPLSQALVTGENDPILQDLATIVMQKVDKLKPEVKRGLMRVANKESFDDDDATLMQAMIRYAAVEELRQSLPEFLNREAVAQSSSLEISPHVALATYVYNPAAEAMNLRNIQEMNMRLAQNISRGVAANRSMGGCSAVDLAGGDGEEKERNAAYNDMFARADNPGLTRNRESEGSGACEYTMSACYCCPYNSDGTDAKTTYTVKIIRDEDGVATCTRPKCGATMVGDKVTDQGGIFKRAQSLKANNAKAA